MKVEEIIRNQELSDLCASVRDLVACGEYDRCGGMISAAMASYPHAPQPHNLLGIVLEKMGNHTLAMKHFRAAWALDPTYYPASRNLTTYGTFCSQGADAFDECDCRRERRAQYVIGCDSLRAERIRGGNA